VSIIQLAMASPVLIAQNLPIFAASAVTGLSDYVKLPENV
jgi:hypothetical protein